MTDIPRRSIGWRLTSRDAAVAAIRLRAIVCEWAARACSRRTIANLDERSARDLGLSPSQLEFEAQKPFWRA